MSVSGNTLPFMPDKLGSKEIRAFLLSDKTPETKGILWSLVPSFKFFHSSGIANHTIHLK